MKTGDPAYTGKRAEVCGVVALERNKGAHNLLETGRSGELALSRDGGGYK